MPWLDDAPPPGENAKQWQTALSNALKRRIQADKLQDALRELESRYPASSTEVAKVLLGFRARGIGNDDQLLFRYAQAMLQLKIIGTSDLLLALLDTSCFSKRPEANHYDKPRTGMPTCEERMINMLCQMHISGELSFGVAQAHELLFVLTRWMHAVTEFEMGKQLEGGALHAADAFSYSTYEAIASLVLTILSNPKLRDVAKKPWWKKRRPTVVAEMENFDSHVLQWMQSQLAGRLRALTTFPPFLNTDQHGRPVFTDQQILQQVVDLPVVNSRAGLFIWLNACLCARPLTDDLAMLTYLQNRFSGNNQMLGVDLLVASFDVITNALIRKESEQSLLIVRSFICNKLVHLLSMISAFTAPSMTSETCIQMAFMSITMDAVPPISAGSTEVRERLKTTRLEFLQACALHNLISETTVASVLQEPSVTLPKVNKYTRDGLLAQVSHNVGRLEPLLEELQGMVSNAGVIASVIIDTVGNLCASKDTMSLKNLCNMLIKKTSALDIIMQYTQAKALFSPLCTQLNEWIHDQDQTEFTPAYEEFASILLFVLVAVHRYNLSGADLGLPAGDTFMSKFLRETSISRLPGDLTEDQKGQLGKWIEELYATDEQGETSGISDEVMRQCSPQAFYQLVPTLFEQSVLACKAGALSMKTFKGGLELLVEPFLLPSMVGGLSWLIQHSWEDHKDADVLLQILQKLLQPSSSSSDTKAMHRAILAIVAKPLYHSLQNLSQKRPSNKDVSKLMEILKPYLGEQRTIETDSTELDEWTATPDGGLTRRIRNAIKDQISWVSNIGPTPPPKYTHKLFAAGCDALGADTVLHALMTEIKEQTATGSGSLALDVCTAMISAPMAQSLAAQTLSGSPMTQMQSALPSVRDALRLATGNAQRLLNLPTVDAEALVRLARRVDAQLTVTQIPQISMALPMPEEATDQMMADLGLTDGELGVTGADVSMDPITDLGAATGTDFNNADLAAALDQPMDLSQPAQNLANMPSGLNSVTGDPSNDIFADLNLDINASGQQMMDTGDGNLAMGTNDGQNNDDDIFAGLDMGDLGDDFNFN